MDLKSDSRNYSASQKRKWALGCRTTGIEGLRGFPDEQCHIDEAKPEGEPSVSLKSNGFRFLNRNAICRFYALIYHFFALPPMSGPSGQPVGAIHDYARLNWMVGVNRRHMVLYSIRQAKSSAMSSTPNIKPIATLPDDLRLQIPNIKRILEAMGIAMLEVPNYEADDVAAIAHQIDEAGGKAFLVTSDKDCRQLISDNVKCATSVRMSFSTNRI